MRQVLQSVIEVITKCDRYYKARRLLQSATVHGGGCKPKNEQHIRYSIHNILAMTTIITFTVDNHDPAGPTSL